MLYKKVLFFWPTLYFKIWNIDLVFSVPTDTTMDVPALNNQTVTLAVFALEWGANATGKL